MICRLGHVTKKEIGAIRIFDRDTTVEIAADVAPRFASAVRRAGDDDVRIEPAEGGAAPGQRPTREARKPFPKRAPKAPTEPRAEMPKPRSKKRGKDKA
jgi:ATP-dependent RNA helicase DeaD